MKKLGLGLLGLAVILVAGLFFAPGFVDWNAHKGRISQEVFDFLGRDLTIDTSTSSFMALAILGAPGVQYKLNEFIFLGTP